MNEELTARLAHEANRGICQCVGDDSQLPWDDAPDWQRRSVMDGIAYLRENPDATPEQSHENWLRHKQDEGWRWGETKDPVEKTHPCMMPYADLPVEQKAKDHVFRAIVLTMHPVDDDETEGRA